MSVFPGNVARCLMCGRGFKSEEGEECCPVCQAEKEELERLIDEESKRCEGGER